MVAGQYPGVRQYSANRGGVGSSTASFENSKRRIVATPMYCRIRNTPWFHPCCGRLGRGYTYPEVFSVPASSIIHYYGPYPYGRHTGVASTNQHKWILVKGVSACGQRSRRLDGKTFRLVRGKWSVQNIMSHEKLK